MNAQQRTTQKDGNGTEWQCYQTDSILIAISNDVVKENGKYYQLNVVLQNMCDKAILFSTDNFKASIMNKGKAKELEILNEKEYVKRCQKKSFFSLKTLGMVTVAGAGGGMKTAKKDNVASVGNQLEGIGNMMAGNINSSSQSSIAQNSQNYIQEQTLTNGMQTCSHLCIPYKKGDSLVVTVNINDTLYEFEWKYEK